MHGIGKDAIVDIGVLEDVVPVVILSISDQAELDDE